ncbi:MAG: lysylphosphatidylglycerol synthase transmembrane domain-containing protein [Ignavibacteria bacterium]
MFKKYKQRIILSIIAGVIVYLGFSIYADFDNLAKAVVGFNWLYFPLVLLLSLFNYLIRYFKWEYYLSLLNIRIKKTNSLLIFLSAFTMSVTPGKLGEVFKSYLLKEENGTSISYSAPIVIAERLTDFLSIVILCLIGAIVFNYGRILVVITGVVFILVIILISYRTLSIKIITLISKIRFLERYGIRLRNSYESIYLLVKIKPLLVVIALSVVSWFFECVGFYLVVNSFTETIEVSILSATFIYAFSTLLGAIMMLPGGLGATEASLTGLLIYLKIPEALSVASALIIRIATLWFAIVIGIISLSIYQRRKIRPISEIPSEDNG